MPSFAELAAVAPDPARIDDLSPEGIPALLGELKEVEARLWVRLQASSAPTAAPTTERNGGEDRLPTTKEAAEQLGVSVRWIYRHSGTLPFTKRLAAGTLRFSQAGLERWRARK